MQAANTLQNAEPDLDLNDSWFDLPTIRTPGQRSTPPRLPASVDDVNLDDDEDVIDLDEVDGVVGSWFR